MIATDIQELLWPMVGAAVAAGLIGAEREYRSSPAGFRTHILVGLSSGLLMLAAVHQVQWLTDTPNDIIRIDPVRMAHGILTGIGFLCGGVIFREGVTVRGLTTAASLWTTSALGILFGVGFYKLAIGATLASVLVLAAADVTERLLPQRRFTDLVVRYRRDGTDRLAGLTALLDDHGAQPRDISQRVTRGWHEVSATLALKSKFDAAALSQALQADPDILAFDVGAQRA